MLVSTSIKGHRSRQVLVSSFYLAVLTRLQSKAIKCFIHKFLWYMPSIFKCYQLASLIQMKEFGKEAEKLIKAFCFSHFIQLFPSFSLLTARKAMELAYNIWTLLLLGCLLQNVLCTLSQLLTEFTPYTNDQACPCSRNSQKTNNFSRFWLPQHLFKLCNLKISAVISKMYSTGRYYLIKE